AADVEDRLEKFAQLVATAIANAEARDRVSALVDEQAALRRVATLVAQDAAQAEIFAAVSVEVDRLFLDEDASGVAGVVRFDPGPEHLVVGVSRTVEVVSLGSRWKPDDLIAPTLVLRTGRWARVDEGGLAVGGPPAEFSEATRICRRQPARSSSAVGLGERFRSTRGRLCPRTRRNAWRVHRARRDGDPMQSHTRHSPSSR